MSAPQNVPRFGEELGATLRLAAPIAAAQLAQIAMGTTDTILLGSLGQDSLAAGGLGANLFFTFMIIFQSTLASVGILVAQARGSGDHARIAPVLRGGFTLATLIGILPMLLLWQAQPILRGIGEPDALAHAISRYVRVLLLAMPAAMWMGVQRSYLSAMARPSMMMTVALVAVIINGVLNYGLIHGAFGLPRLGYIGSCTATAITLWGQCVATAIFMRSIKELRPYRLLGSIDWRVVRELAVLGWPIAITVGVEIALFSVAALIIGTFGATMLAAHQISINIASVTFMVPFAIAQAANVRVGFHMGAGIPKAAGQAGTAAFMLGVSFMALAATAMLTIPHLITSIYLKADDSADAPVIAVAVRMLAIAALFQVFDGAQTIAAGALRGLKDTRVPMFAAAFGYWGVGFVISWVLAFPLGMGPIGIWWGFVLGLASVAVLLVARFQNLIRRLIAADGQMAWASSGSAACPAPVPQ